MTLKNKRVPLLSKIKLCASFHRHMWIQTGVTVRKWLNGVMTSVTLTFDLWPWPLAWTSCLSMVINPENFRLMRWQEHSQRGGTDGQTDPQTEISVLRAAWSQLKIERWCCNILQVHILQIPATKEMSRLQWIKLLCLLAPFPLWYYKL